MEYQVLVDGYHVDTIEDEIRCDIYMRDVIKQWAWSRFISPKGVCLRVIR